MRIDILTLFPEMCETVLNESIIGRAQKNGLVEIQCHNIRNYTTNKHGRVDDYPYGGGMGMVMAPQPIYDCCQAVTNGEKTHIIYMSPKGATLTQEKVKELSKLDRITILCGHYEGVDQRLLDELVDEEISVGDYVLTGGELPALVLTDAVCRMLDGVLSDPSCFTEESFFSGRLEYPHYTRPEEWRGKRVPEVLLSGHHENIRKWREEQSLEITKKLRPDLLKDE